MSHSPQLQHKQKNNRLRAKSWRAYCGAGLMAAASIAMAGCNGSPQYHIVLHKDVYVGTSQGQTPGTVSDIHGIQVNYTTKSDTSISEQIKAAQELAAKLR